MRKRVAKALQSWEEADEVLQEIGRLDRELGKLADHQNKIIDRVKAETKDSAELFLKDKKALELALEQFCTSRKEEFKTVRSKKLTFGTVSFRLSTRLVIKSLEKTLAALKELGWTDCIRTKEEPDKEELKALGAKSAGLLAQVGCKLKTEDAFGYEVDQQKIQAAEDAA